MILIIEFNTKNKRNENHIESKKKKIAQSDMILTNGYNIVKYKVDLM
jgi:hypothetical protein